MKALPVILAVFFFIAPTQAKYSGGTGEPDDPYRIATAQDLIVLGENPQDYDKHFILTTDIDLDPNLPGRKVFDSAVIAPDTNDGKFGFQGTRFTGVFDGSGHTISHLTIAGGSYLGLFGRLGSKNQVRNLGVVDINISGLGDCVSGLVGFNSGTITNGYIEGGNVSGVNKVGGLVGYNSGGTLNYCYSACAVSGKDRVGGLVGTHHWSGSISNSYSTGSVTGSENHIGGLVGYNSDILNCCYSTCAVSGEDSVGGLVGINRFGSISNSYSTGNVTGSGYHIGGLVGLNYDYSDLNRCYSTGSVSGNERVGGLVGTDSGRVLYAVWDVETSSLSGSAGGVGLTTAQMMDPYMLALNGFGNNPNWIIDSGRDYPRLTWEGTSGQMIPEPVIDWLEGMGTSKDPFQIEDADQLLLLHTSSVLWDKHFVLSRDIDLNPNLSGRNVFGQAVIPTFEGSFVGNGHVILNLQIEGGGRLGLFGKLIQGSVVRALGLENVSVHGTASHIGGLVGYNSGGYVLDCYSTGATRGDNDVGGLVGNNEGCVMECYSTNAVGGTGRRVGGLVGNNYGYMNYCFWDTQTSGRDKSAFGRGLTTTQMQMANTFLDAGWDFVGETENGMEDIWWILEGQDYPRLRELPEGFRLGPLPAFSPKPQDCAIEVMQPPILHWASAGPTLQHDIYFGEEKKAVAKATTESTEIYRGRQAAGMTTFDPGPLQLGKTYYWRIDEYPADATIGKGHVWNFTTANCILVFVVDDFESYTDFDDNKIWLTWIDGWGDPDNGSQVGYLLPPYAETVIFHGGHQSMPLFYDNTGDAMISEAVRILTSDDGCFDWAIDDADTLTLYFRGEAYNDLDTLYVAIEDRAGRMAVATYPDVDALLRTEWQNWHIPLEELRAAGVDLTAVLKIYIGIGDRDNPQSGGGGKIYIDDILVTNRMP